MEHDPFKSYPKVLSKDTPFKPKSQASNFKPISFKSNKAPSDKLVSKEDVIDKDGIIMDFQFRKNKPPKADIPLIQFS